MQYTFSERTVKNKTVGQACQIAKQVLKEKYNIHELCTNAVHNRPNDESITVVELNTLVSNLVDDTVYHKGVWFGAR